jgi:hypothetical protein
MAAKRGMSKVRDEGAWTLGQVLLWIKTRHIELVREIKAESYQGYYFQYQSMRESKFHDPAFPTQLEGESQMEWEERFRAYHVARFEREKPLMTKAREDFLEALRTGKVIALDKTGTEISKSRWQVIDLCSTEAIKKFVYPSRIVGELWPEPAPGKPTDEQVKNLVFEMYQESLVGRTPKQDAVKREVRSRLPGATFKQINAALSKIPKTAKNSIGRPKKIKTQN